MIPSKSYFVPPGLLARAINRLYGCLTAFGMTPSYSYLLQTKGRKTGAFHDTPVNLLHHNERLYVVGTRGHTQWSRNVLVGGSVTLKRGRMARSFRMRELPDGEKADVLKAYLNRFQWMAWRFFPVAAGDNLSDFAVVADRYPVFELVSDS